MSNDKRYCEIFMPDTMSDSVCLICGEPKVDHPVELTRNTKGQSMSVAHSKRLDTNLHPIFEDSIVDRRSKNYIPCRRDGDPCNCISVCKRINK